MEARVHSPIKSDEEVLIFPSAAYQQGNFWIVPIRGWIFEPEKTDVLRRAFMRMLMKAVGVRSKSVGGQFFRKRMSWFLVDNERGKKIPIELLGHHSISERSRSDGHFRGLLKIPKKQITSESAFAIAHTKKHDLRSFGGTIHFVPPTGVSVISDIDDTIKTTHVASHQSSA